VAVSEGEFSWPIHLWNGVHQAIRQHAIIANMAQYYHTLFLLTLAACSNAHVASSDAGSRAGPCDPLAPHELPVTLGTVLGVGQDSAGTIYMADEVTAPYSDRVFVSSGNSLWRKRVSGSGQSGGTADRDYTFSYVNGSNNQALLIQIRGGVTAAMALGPGDSRAFVGAADSGQSALTVLDRSAISTMTLRNLPGDVVIEYVADVSNGNIVIVTRPQDDWTDKSFKVFYGTPNAMIERPLISFSRGNDTYITFQVDSAPYLAHFVLTMEPADGGVNVQHPPGTLEPGDGSTWTLTERLPTPTALAEFSFTCLGS